MCNNVVSLENTGSASICENTEILLLTNDCDLSIDNDRDNRLDVHLKFFGQ